MSQRPIPNYQRSTVSSRSRSPVKSVATLSKAGTCPKQEQADEFRTFSKEKPKRVNMILEPLNLAGEELYKRFSRMADRVMRHGGIGSTKELLDSIDASTQIPQMGIL